MSIPFSEIMRPRSLGNIQVGNGSEWSKRVTLAGTDRVFTIAKRYIREATNAKGEPIIEESDEMARWTEAHSD